MARKNTTKYTKFLAASFLQACRSLHRVTKNRSKKMLVLSMSGLVIIAGIVSIIATSSPAQAIISSKYTTKETCAAAGGTWKVYATSPYPQEGCDIDPLDSMTPEDRAKLYTNYRVSLKCMDSMKGSIKTVAGNSGATEPSQGDKNRPGGTSGWDYEWFSDYGTSNGYVYSAGKQDCYQIMQSMISLAGFEDGKSLLRAMGYTYDDGVPQWKGTDDTNTRRDKFSSAIKNKIGDPDKLNDQSSLYVLYLNGFTNSAMGTCSATKKIAYDKGDATQKKWADDGGVHDGVTWTKVNIVEGSGENASPVTYIYTYNATTSTAGEGGTAQSTNYGTIYSGIQQYYPGLSWASGYKCSEFPKLINDTAQPYANWLKLHNAAPGTSTDGQNGQSGGGEGDEKSSCAIGGVGWIICPTVNFLAGIADSAYAFLADNFLKVDIRVIQANGDNTTFTAWQQFLRFGNIFLIIAFIVIIYSQLTGGGLSNYTAKKMLPKIIVAAVLINLSFFICQAAVDLSNVLGYGLKNFLAGLAGHNNAISAGVDATGDGAAGWVGTAGLVLGAGAAGAAAAGGITLGLVALLGMLIAAVVSLFVIFFILVIRQVGIILLIILAPVAFAAYILPNTEQWFTKWRKAFIALLMVFPIIGVVFGASTLASDIMQQIYSKESGENLIGKIVAAGIMVIPLIVVPGLLKKSLDSLGSIGGKLSGLGGKLSGKAQAGVKNSKFAGYQKGLADKRKALIGAGAFKGSNRNPANWLRNARSGINRGLNNNDAFNTVTGGFGQQQAASGVSMAEKQEAEEIGMHQTLLKGKSADDWLAVMNDKKASTEKRAAAAGLLASSGSRSHQLAAIHAASKMASSGDSAAGAMQKQMLSQMGNRVPFALGDAARAEMMQGKYTGNIYEDLAKRASSHLTAEKAANLDIDELTELANISTGAKSAATDAINETVTNPSEQDALRNSVASSVSSRISEVEADDILKNSVAERDRVQYDRIRGAAPSASEVPSNQPTAKAQAEQRAAQAAQGTSGDTVFAVDHSGEVTRQSSPAPRSSSAPNPRDNGVAGHGDFMDSMK